MKLIKKASHLELKITSIPFKYFNIINPRYNLAHNELVIVCYSVYKSHIVLFTIEDNAIDVLKPIIMVNIRDNTMTNVNEVSIRDGGAFFIDFLFLFYIVKVFPQSIFYYENKKKTYYVHLGWYT